MDLHFIKLLDRILSMLITAISRLRSRILVIQHPLQATLLRIHIRAVLHLELELPQHWIISMTNLTHCQIRRPPLRMHKTGARGWCFAKRQS